MESGTEFEALVAYMAHELKTPIVGLKGFADLLSHRHGACLPDDGTLCLEKIRLAAGILEEMVDGLGNLVEAAGPPAPADRLDPLPVLQLAADALAREAQEGGVEVSLPGAAPQMLCNRAALFQLFQNLLANAIRHCDRAKPARWVRVGVEEAGSEVEVWVSDNGVGLEPDEIPEVFQPFRRGRRAMGTRGLGLGLAISLRVAERCGGRIETKSIPGEGSTFSIFLPRAV